MPDSPSKVVGGVGTLYAAPLGTTEPTSVTGGFPAGWVNLGFTDAGSVFTIDETWQDMTVEESYWAIRKVLTMMKGTLEFNLAESTAQNLALSLNNGFPLASAISGSTGTNADGSLWVEPPTPGTEVRVMLAWDALTLGEAQAIGGQTPYGRLIVRQAVNTAGVKQTNKKGSSKRLWTCKFEVEQPTNTPLVGSQPVHFLLPASLQS
jgi:hypothetical protein